MPRRALLLALGMAAGTAALAQPSQPPQVIVRGTVTTSSGEHPAWFTLICTQGAGGALSLQLALGTASAPDFPFDAFEGPRAPASYQPSAQLQVGTQRFAAVSVAGWLSGDRDGAFVFGVATTHKHDTVTAIAAALSKPGMTLSWTQSGNNLQTPPLLARFTPDVQQAHALSNVVAPCLSGYRQGG
jgi:hypothetical protein